MTRGGLTPRKGLERRPKGTRAIANATQRGIGTVTPREPLAWIEDGVREVLTPGVSRLSVAHVAVAERPELFTLCDKSDGYSHKRLGAHLERAARDIAAELARRRGGITVQSTSTRRPPLKTAWRL